MSNKLPAFVAWPAIIGLALVFFLTGGLGWLLSGAADGLISAASWARKSINQLK